ncbi:ABC transporter ATP-binding protein [Pseudonocardia humida]|uniref:ATP-binding cassette domain-containing protein n=1 Tax=Pseudonocardia humida TaxID=2800819 RepID=A0ABT0ZZW7_9PSEU|nr:ATP-binding cassette domain-containing protein [Pseudonocardia humida]MCO1656292.1 ATP-binding cassette domain-containing protein [Pseudonocardia humida]
MTPGLSCRDLSVHADGRELVQAATLHVPAGRTLAVLGPNGAGKSTLLRALGLLGRHRTTGEVLLDGRPVTPTQMRAAVGAVLQRPILRRGTVVANVASGLRFRGVGRREADDRARPWLDALGIAHLAARDARTLSGGEAQRVSIARALAVGPRVLLLDEPFTGLDPTTRADLVADLRAALDHHAAAAVLVTHDRHEALALAHDTALLIRGRVRQHGPTRCVLDDPRDPETARLLGYTNLVPPGTSGRPHTLAARPEHCRLVPGATDPADVPEALLVVAGTLRRGVRLGRTTRLDVDTPAGPLTCLDPDEPPAPIPPTNSPVVVAVGRARPLRAD